MKTNRYYSVVEANEKYIFERNVEYKLTDGWSLHGAPTLITNQHGMVLRYVQPMYKEERYD